MTEQQVVQEKPDRKDLKIQALVNKVTKTENENADYQVELHLANEARNELLQEVANLSSRLQQLESEVTNVEESPSPEPTE